jgi:aryl-alcohol dehydrogenase-like predicted oxidoreductase
LTKGAHPYPPKEPQRVRPEFIRSDIEESLERLQTDSVELYLLHRDDPTFPVDEIVDVLNELHDKGYIGAFGGSNWSYQRVKAANDYANANGKTPFTITSPQFGVAEMVKPPWDGCISVSGEQGEAARAWYDANDIAVIPWSSLAGGFLTGKYTRDNLDQFDSYWDTVSIDSYAFDDNFKRLDRIQELANAKGASPAQISIAYILNNNPRNHAIVANWDVDTIGDNLKALDITLTPDEVRYIELKTEDKPE